MLLAILSFAGTCILFFGYDSAVMAQVNINPDYLQRMNINHGTTGDAARVGGLVSLWFAGFFIGRHSQILDKPQIYGAWL